MLGRLLWLGFEQQRAGEADLALVFRNHREEPGELIALLLEAGVEQRLVALAATPQHVVGAAEVVRGLEHVTYLRGCVGEHFRIRIRGRTSGVPRVGEQVRGAPQQLHACFGLLLRGALDEHVEVRLALGQRGALGGHVDVVEAVEGRAQLVEELERGILFGEGGGHRIDTGLQPGSVEGSGAEHVAAGPVEAVPIADSNPEVVFHPLASDHAVRVVHRVPQTVAGGSTRRRDSSRYLSEELAHGWSPSASPPVFVVV